MRLILDGARLRYPSRAHRVLARKLRFPAWYGRNLDALYDCLTDLHEDTELVLVNWTAPGLQMLRRVMEDAAAENPHLTVAVE
ncbi:MAG: barstar family protein [Oscillospiraceae bacterium]|jgi:ribonuclease inhibitor|nr:barstar family protein [Oscillospiraceae bacterium]